MKKWLLTAAAAATLASVAWGAYSAAGPSLPFKNSPEMRGISDPASVASSFVKDGARKAAAVDGAFNLPVSLEPTSEESESFIVLDVNNDGKKWAFDFGGCMVCSYNSSMASDDWFLVPVRLTAEDNVIRYSYEVAVKSSTYPENLKVGFGNGATPESITVYDDLPELKNTAYVTHSRILNLGESAADGIFYLGFYCYSDADKYGVKVRNIKVESLAFPIPNDPVIASSAVADGHYTATVTMPTQTVQGNDITGALGLEVKVDGETVSDMTDCSAGQNVEVSLELTSGSHTVSYLAYLDENNHRENSQEISESVRVIIHHDYAVPVSFTPTDIEFEEFVVEDANADNHTWELMTDNGEPMLSYTYSTNNQADDWVFLPPVDFGEGGIFQISLDQKNRGQAYSERYEIAVGRAASSDSMNVVIVPDAVTNPNWETFTGTFSLEEGGKWVVGIHCVSPKNLWTLFLRNISLTVSNDLTPAVPVINSVNMNGLTGTVNVTLPAKAADGNDLSVPVGAVVLVDGVETTRTELTEPGSTIDIPVELTLGKHTLSVSSYTGEGEDVKVSPAVLHELVASQPEGYLYPLPFYMQPTKGEFETFTVLDANADGHTWDFNNEAGVMICRTAGEEEADDWVFLPAFEVTDITKIYNVSITARSYLEYLPEDFDLCIGKEATPESMTILSAQNGFNNYLYGTVTVPWTAPEAGGYVIGIHRRSPGSAHTLSVKDIKVEESGKTVFAPAACEVVSARSDENGVLEATVVFNMPSKSVSDTDLAADDMLTAVLTSTTGATSTATGAPGSQHTLTVAAAEGHSNLTLSVSSAVNGTGDPVEIPVYCGPDIPSAPAVTCEISEDNMHLTITWTDAETGEQGGSVNKAQLQHSVYVPADENMLYWNKLADLEPGVSTYEFDADALQDITYIGVTARNDRGESQIGAAFAVTGTPYSLPMSEDLTDGNIGYNPVMLLRPTEEYSSNWFVDKPSLIFPNLGESEEMAIMCIETESESETPARFGRVVLPKFTTENAHAPKASFSIYNSTLSAKASVYAETFGAEPVKIGELPGAADTEGWHEYTLDLPEALVGKKWVNFYIEVEFTSYPQAFVMQKYNVRSTYQKQLALYLDTPAEFVVGQTNEFKAVVENISETAQTLPALECTLTFADSRTIELTGSFSEAEVAPGAKAEAVFSFVPEVADMGLSTATVSFADYTDEDNTDNTATAYTEVTTGNLPIVIDLAGELDADGNFLLTWTVPETEAAELAEEQMTVVGFDVLHNQQVVAEEHPDAAYTVEDWAANDAFTVQTVVTVNSEKKRMPSSNVVVVEFSGIDGVVATGTISGARGYVLVSGMEGCDVRVFGADGREVARRDNVSASERIELQSGVYVVAAGDAQAKVLVY